MSTDGCYETEKQKVDMENWHDTLNIQMPSMKTIFCIM
jgi:major membrane immunogen (membrane-anchored lipoprotein)